MAAIIFIILTLFFLSILMYIGCRRIGTLLAAFILIAIATINVLLAELGFAIDFYLLSFNGLSYKANLMLILLLLLIFIILWLFRCFTGKKGIVVFLISVLILQNLLFSGMIDFYRSLEEYDIFNDFSFFFAIPITYIGVFLWGLIFDFARNKSKKFNKTKEEIA